jgi:ribosomal protein S27AE
MPTERPPGRFVVVRIDLGEVSDHTASKMGDQLVEFAGAVGERVEIIEEGITAELDAIVCPNCGNDSFQEHGTMQFKQPVSLKRGENGALEVDDYTSASEPIDELSEPVGVACSHCLLELDVSGYDAKNTERRQRIARLIDGYSGAPDDPESDLTDALTDMCHLAVARGYKFEELTERALSHFCSESQQGAWVTCMPGDILDAQRDAMSATAGVSSFCVDEFNQRTGAVRFVVIGEGSVGKYYEVAKDGTVTDQD